jgi:hypothetical protein
MTHDARSSNADGECSCAMTEGSMRRCPVHGEDAHRQQPDAVRGEVE